MKIKIKIKIKRGCRLQATGVFWRKVKGVSGGM